MLCAPNAQEGQAYLARKAEQRYQSQLSIAYQMYQMYLSLLGGTSCAIQKGTDPYRTAPPPL